jgi:hypothetical protein
MLQLHESGKAPGLQQWLSAMLAAELLPTATEQ